ncbi:hypothetical protein Pth03_11820 [Planotetraspora thailandica]|uniref:Type II restriction enzyme NaeI domain-containing protein n=1 Tax=Planotetraspora thailandica TaxID=487172 RepID=A0A8J3UWZ7_9ACTN|nr:NaeI family type II restriction endonuclease [Planotetraspora thailandica]GII52793.1 hypothetical protein Pth03_11820 [Planotetraspora thailandica]
MADTLDFELPERSRSVVETAAIGTGDDALDAVASWFEGHSNLEARFGEILRQSIDEVLDGQRTGRFDLAAKTVVKTERTYLGTKVEIICQAAFNLQRGRHMDYLIDGHEVDAKFSGKGLVKQSIPREAVGEICLLMHADDTRGTFSAGLLRTTPDVLSPGKGNQDGKREILAAARSRIRWLVHHGRLPENLLLKLPEATRQAIFNPPGVKGRGNSGQQRVNQLFRLVQRRIVRREVVLTVAQQDDGPKRVRDARKSLLPEGILILGHQDRHPHIARELNVPIPQQGQWISVQVVPVERDDPRPSTLLGGNRYSVVRAGESVHAPSPLTSY